jgi:hypothetical protein
LVLTRWFKFEFLVAFAAICVGLALLYFFVSTDVVSRYGYASRARAVAGALALVGGGSVWVLIKLKDLIVNRLGGITYSVSFQGSEEHFHRKNKAEERIRELIAAGTPSSGIRLTKVITTIAEDGSLTTRTEDIGLESRQ